MVLKAELPWEKVLLLGAPKVSRFLTGASGNTFDGKVGRIFVLMNIVKVNFETMR